MYTKSNVSSDRSALGRLRVLVVDDDQDARDLIGILLRAYGADVVTAASAARALELVKRERFDALVSDIAMPDQDGYELMRAIRALRPEWGGDLPAIAVTAHGGDAHRDRALAAGYNWHVAKPVDSMTLIELISGVILGRRMRQ